MRLYRWADLKRPRNGQIRSKFTDQVTLNAKSRGQILEGISLQFYHSQFFYLQALNRGTRSSAIRNKVTPKPINVDIKTNTQRG